MAIKFLNTVAVDTNVLYVDAAANKVGIGTTSPSTQLSVNGAISAITSDYVQGTTGSRLLMHSAGTGNSHSYIQAQNSGGTSNAEDLALQLYGGNVGIGTDSPARQLTLSGYSSPVVSLKSNTTGGEPSIYFGDTADDRTGRLVYSNSDNSMRIWTNQNERAVVNKNGDTGIGVTLPRAKLDVAGGVKVADDTDGAAVSKVGTLRYRYVPGSPKNYSYVDMCMQTGTSSYDWVNIVQNVW